ncbi:MAG TPA: glycosyltransferase family 2 protein [Gemmatimonadales bacterium]|nr:glycosyltransferase family 2 protein [Gemmatimonadales bacterium]
MIYVLVPAYNEAPTVGLLLWKVRQVFTAFPREYQLLVVDDASTDGTGAVLAPYVRALPLTLVTHREREGYARSLEELLRLATSRSDRPKRDLAVVLQADFSDPPDDIPEMVKRIESGADLVLADYRRRPGMPRAERLARRLVPLLARRGGDSGALEHVGTLKAMRLITLARVLSSRGGRPLLAREGWAADVELLRAVAAQARRVDVVPVTSAARPRRRPSRARPLRSVWQVWRALRTGGPFRERPEPPGGARPERSRPRGRGESRGSAPASVPSS